LQPASIFSSEAPRHYLRANLNFQRNEHSICRNRFDTLQGSITPRAIHIFLGCKTRPCARAAFSSRQRFFQPNCVRPVVSEIKIDERIVEKHFSSAGASWAANKSWNIRRTAQMKPNGMGYRSGRRRPFDVTRLQRLSFITGSRQAPTSQATALIHPRCVNCTPVTRQGRHTPRFIHPNSGHLCSRHSHYLYCRLLCWERHQPVCIEHGR
jgi:hypothetical protein